MTSSFDTFRRAIEASQLKTANVRADSMSFQCPAHPDRNPSASAAYKNGKVLVHCFTGCDSRDVVDALGLKMDDLFDEEPSDKNSAIVARYKYLDGAGNHVFTKLRLYPKSFRITSPDESSYGMPKGAKPWLYRNEHWRGGVADGSPLWLVEGEADVHAIESMGGFATTQPWGAGPDKWTPWHSNLLEWAKVKEARIVVDLDDDRSDGHNTGREYALAVRDSLAARGINVTLWKAKGGKDASDHLRQGYGLEDFEQYKMPRQRPAGITHADLMKKEFKPLVFAVENILPQGLALLGGPPKLGKSLIALNMAMAVAAGENGRALSKLKVTPGRVLYIGMEDSMRRLKDRITAMEMGNAEGLDNIEFQPIESAWEGGTVGMAMMEEWATEADNPRLIVLDTLARVEPELEDSKDRYRAEYAMTLRYKQFADRHDLSILMIHHDKKGEELDWLSRFSGSRGLTGGVDTLLFLDGRRGEQEAILRVTGRDIEGDDLPLRRVNGRPGWIVDEIPDHLPSSMSLPAEAATRDGVIPLTEPQRVIVTALRVCGGRARESALVDQFPPEDGSLARTTLDQLVFKGVIKRRGQELILA